MSSDEGSVNTTTVALTALHTRKDVTEGTTLAEGPSLPIFPLLGVVEKFIVYRV